MFEKNTATNLYDSRFGRITKLVAAPVLLLALLASTACRFGCGPTSTPADNQFFPEKVVKKSKKQPPAPKAPATPPKETKEPEIKSNGFWS